MPSHTSGLSSSPVFVDPRGRRRRWAVLAAWAAAVLGAAYLALVVSALLGGPTVQSPFLPSPISADAPVTPSLPTPAAQDTDDDVAAVSTDAVQTVRTTTPPPTQPTTPATDPTTTPTTPTTPPTTPETTAHGRSDDAHGREVSATTPGSDRRPTTAPTDPDRTQP